MKLKFPSPDATPEEIEAYLEAVDYKMTVPLRKAVELGDRHDKLELREPTAAEWAQWSGLRGVESDIKAVSVVSGLSETEIRQVGARELVAAARFIALFLD